MALGSGCSRRIRPLRARIPASTNSFPGLEKGKVWDSYVENSTPEAWRIYWMYGPNEVRHDAEVSVITVLVIGHTCDWSSRQRTNGDCRASYR